MAVKQQKLQEKDQKRTQAQQTVELLLKNPELMLLSDHKQLEKDLNTGFGIKITDEPVASSDTPVTGPMPGGQPTNVNPGQLAAVGNAAQGSKAGAQAATPPSDNAAGKAPGGGVASVGNPQQVEQIAAMAHDSMMKKYGALAPLYGSAMNQVQMEQLKAKGVAEMEQLKHNAMGGDLQSMGRLYALAGHEVTDSTMRNMIMSSNMDNKVVGQALDFALGNETEAAKALRFDSTLKTLSSNPEIMGKLAHPEDITSIARSVVYGGKLPEGIQMKPFSVDELAKEAEYEKYLVTEVGLPYDFSHTIARSRSLGLDLNLSMPKGMQTLAQRKVGATEKQASASMLSAQAEWKKAGAEWEKIKITAADKENKDLMDTLAQMTEADKAKHPWPDEVKSAVINRLAVKSGLMPERVKHWYNLFSGGEWQYTPIPDSELARQAAGGAAGPAGSKPKKREKTLAEEGGAAGKLGINVPPAVREEGPMRVSDNPLRLPGEAKAINKALDYTINPLYEAIFGKRSGEGPGL
jgi:hypothetical protein